ncbi:2-oxoglutarate dehydrogenase E1 component [Nymphon striatum]|nr:2-oxoglutarate dehydrogenase E1 component [Nymphon striatum]
MNKQTSNIETTPEGKMVDTHSLLDGNSVVYLESLYEDYLRNPEDVPADLHSYFSGFADSAGSSSNGSEPESFHTDIRAKFKKLATAKNTGGAVQADSGSSKQIKVLQLINSYRFLGHKRALTNPLDEAFGGEPDLPKIPELTLQYHDLSEGDLSSNFQTGSLVAKDELSLKEIVKQLEKTYCDVIGSQYMYISNTEEKRWIQNRLEGRAANGGFTPDQSKRVLKKLIAAETLERYLHTKYVGQKRFSLEGGDSLIPMLDTLIQHMGEKGGREVVLGMAHRGRLNSTLFKEFEGSIDNGGRSGDVKYHMGYSSDMSTPGESVHLSLAFNPSHLEIVGPVVEGAVRARQDRRHHDAKRKVIPVVIHGDAALAGQGVNMETLNMSETTGYRTHGTIHIVINNQIGFTTSTVSDARSTEYCTGFG